MFVKLLSKLMGAPTALRLKVYPRVNRWLFRAKGIKYGKNLCVYNEVLLRIFGDVRIGDNFVYVSGDGISPISGNKKGAIYVSADGVVRIGDNVGMTATCMWIEESLVIGNRVSIGADCLLMDTDCHPLDYRLRNMHPQNEEEQDFVKKSVKRAPIVIEDDVWMGAHCIVLKGVRIGARSVIGAGSVVTKDIPSDSIAVGNPARVVRTFSSC